MNKSQNRAGKEAKQGGAPQTKNYKETSSTINQSKTN